MGWWCVFIIYFVLQDNTVENLARDWFADVQLIDTGSGETFNMSGPSTARFEKGFAVFEGVIFLFEGRNFQLEFTVQGGWSGKCDQIYSSTSYHSYDYRSNTIPWRSQKFWIWRGTPLLFSDTTLNKEAPWWFQSHIHTFMTGTLFVTGFY